MESYKVIWDDKEMGHLTNPMPDMSYLEGDWKSNGTSDSVIFERLVKSFDPRQVMTDLTKGLVITLRGNEIGDFNLGCSTCSEGHVERQIKAGL